MTTQIEATLVNVEFHHNDRFGNEFFIATFSALGETHTLTYSHSASALSEMFGIACSTILKMAKY